MARAFTGSLANRIDIGDIAAIDITGTALSISAWVRPASVTGSQFVVAKWDGEGNTTLCQYVLFLSGTAVQFSIHNGTTQDGATTGTVSTSVWQHMGGVKNGTGAGAIVAYYNGVGTSATSNISIQNTAANLKLGADTDASIAPYNGRLAEVAIWDVALSAGEMAALAAGVCPLFFRRDHLKMYLPLWATVSPEVDLSGSGISASITGTLSLADHAPVGRLAPGR